MIAIVVWSSLAWHYGLPTSETHALVASLTGAGFATGGLGRAAAGDGLEEGADRPGVLDASSGSSAG